MRNFSRRRDILQKNKTVCNTILLKMRIKMKRNLNLLALILVFCIVAVGLEGCGMSKEEKILKHLENKYGETFVVDEFIGAGWDVHYNEFHCHSDLHPDERFAVFEYSDGEIGDDYFGVLAKPKYEEMLRCYLDKYFNDYKLFFNFTQPAFNDRFTDSNKLESYIKSAPRIFDTNITVFTNNEDIDDTEFETICNDLQKQFVCFTISIEVFDEQEYLEANEENFIRIFGKKRYEKIVKGDE